LANGIRIFPEHDNQYAIYASFYQNVLIDCTAAIAVIDNKPQPSAPMNSIPGATSSRRVKFAANVQIGRRTRLTQ
jgi:hypothetical protein